MCTHTDNRWFSNDSESKLSSSFPKILCSVRVSLSLFLSASLCIHSFNDILKSHLAKTEFSFPDTCALLGTRVRLYKTLFLSPHPPLFSPPPLSNHINHWSDDLWPLFIELDRGSVSLLTSLNGHVDSRDYGSQKWNSQKAKKNGEEREK